MSGENDAFELSRRKALAGLGTIGIASAGAGLGTSAFFSDTESFEDNQLTAGELDLAVRADVYEYQGQANGGGQSFGGVKNGQSPTIRQQLDDVKPGDYSWGTFCFSIVDNPAYVWAGGQLTGDSENGQPEPENDTSPGGELADAIEVTLFYADTGFDPSGKGRPSSASVSDVVFEGTLREALAKLQTGIPLDADPSTTGRDAFTGTSSQSFDEDVCLAFAWEVPTSVGNEIQTDSVTFDLGFAAYQERHNDGSQSPFVDATYTAEDGSGVAKGWQSNWDQTTVTPLSNFPGVNDPRVEISYGPSQVVFQMHLADADELVVGSGSNDSASFPVDVNDDGTTDFEVAFRGDPDGAAPSGENFGYRTFSEGGGPGSYESVDSVDGVSATYDGTTITIGIARSRLTAGGNGYRFAWQEIYRSGSSPIQGIKVPFSLPRWKFEEDGDGDFADSDSFARETVQ